MNVAFPICRANYYRLLGPAIDEALARGWRVTCWHEGMQPGGKVSEFPRTMPAFRHGTPALRWHHGLEDLGRKLAADLPDLVISVDPAPPVLRAATRARWCWLQVSTDILFYDTPQGLVDADGLAASSPHWIERFERRYAATGLHAQIAAKARPVGIPELDVIATIDPDAVRRRLGIDRDERIVLYLPFPLRSNPPTFWLRHVYAPRTRLAQAVRVLAGGRLEYWPDVAAARHDRRLVGALAAFCQANRARLMMKARWKDRVPRYAARLARPLVYDPSYYPPTILELLSIASLCVHHYSTAVLEAAAAGVPSLCLAPRDADMGLPPHGLDVHNGRAGNIYHWPGVAYWRRLEDAFEALPSWRLGEFAADAASRRAYVEHFLGWDDSKSAARLLDFAATLVEKAPQ